MLEQIEALRMDLSNSFIAIRPSADGAWAQNFSCTGTDVYYDPSLCLEVLGYGGYVWSVNIHPPYKGELRVAGRRLGDVSQAAISKFIDPLRPYDDHAFDTVSIEHLFHRLDVLWRQSTEPAPDLFFLHPATHNCHAIEYLFSGAPLQPKILVVPINPLIPPPFEVLPRFEAWWHIMRPAWRNTRLAKGWVQHSTDDSPGDDTMDAMDEYLTTAFWMGQCSLAAVDSMLERMRHKKFRNFTQFGIKTGISLVPVPVFLLFFLLPISVLLGLVIFLVKEGVPIVSNSSGSGCCSGGGSGGDGQGGGGGDGGCGRRRASAGVGGVAAAVAATFVAAAAAG